MITPWKRDPTIAPPTSQEGASKTKSTLQQTILWMVEEQNDESYHRRKLWLIERGTRWSNNSYETHYGWINSSPKGQTWTNCWWQECCPKQCKSHEDSDFQNWSWRVQLYFIMFYCQKNLEYSADSSWRDHQVKKSKIDMLDLQFDMLDLQYELLEWKIQKLFKRCIVGWHPSLMKSIHLEKLFLAESLSVNFSAYCMSLEKAKLRPSQLTMVRNLTTYELKKNQKHEISGSRKEKNLMLKAIEKDIVKENLALMARCFQRTLRKGQYS